ncbi:MAG: hypothetical protein QOH09_1896 [Pseudonocardiales bacterium]|jgi:hypothetical protein|nr:hypothetical protein [Pseudonocardiales bacterium]
MTETYDVIVAGGGSGGVAAALATGHAAGIAAAHTADTGPRPQPFARSATGRTHACSNPRPARTPSTAVTWSLRYR